MIRRVTSPVRRAAVATEFALFVPILTLLFIVGLDFCRVFHHDNMVYSCARQGAHWGSEPLSPFESWYPSLEESAQSDYFDQMAPGVTPTVTYTPVTVGGSAAVRVTARHEFQTVTNIIYFDIFRGGSGPRDWGTSFPIERSITMRISPLLPRDASP